MDVTYRESYDHAQELADKGRMLDFESAYMRDQLMLEILLDVQDLFSVAPAASALPAAPVPGLAHLATLAPCPLSYLQTV